MKYFTKHLWRKMNNADESVRSQAQIEWKKNAEQYQQEFEQIKQYVPKSFLKSFFAHKGFHDYTIDRFFLEHDHGKYRCEMQLTDGYESIRLVLTDVKSVNLDIPSFNSCMLRKLTWGYCEIERTHTKTLRLSIICDIENELQIECGMIKLLK